MDRRYNPRRKRRPRAHDDHVALVEARRRGKFIIAAVLFLGVLAFFSVELFRQQAESHQLAAVRSIDQLFSHYARNDRPLVPNRGSIVDRNMQALAISSITYNVVLDVRMLSRREHPLFMSSARRAMVEVFGFTEEEFNGFMARDANGILVNNTYYLVVARNISHSQFEAYHQWFADNRFVTNEDGGREERLRIIDIHFTQESQRSYIHNSLAATIIGFHRGAYWSPEGVWRGIEAVYNEHLTGSPGRVLTTMEHDRITTATIPPNNGHIVVTTLDLNIQRIAEEIAREHAREYQASVGAVIVMQPFTGEILAMAQYPSFDANAPANLGRITSPERAHQLGQLDPNSQEFIVELYSLWSNFNVSSVFEPGSTFKSNLWAMALEEGLVTPGCTFHCYGFRQFGEIRVHCSARWGHGTINLTEALAFSCNVAAMDIVEMVGRSVFVRYQHDFGFGAVTGIDLPNESRGLLFNEADLNVLELATSSFGQRFLNTPLQSIASFAPMINGGDFMRPFIVSQIIDQQSGEIIFENQPQVQRRILSQDTSDWLRIAHEYTITIGTGRSGAVAGHRVAGKTATAEQGLPGTSDFSWSVSFIGYFPIERPQYLIMTLIYDFPDEVYVARGPGNRTAAPMFAQVVEEIVRIGNIPPDQEGGAVGGDALIMNDFVGMDIIAAIADLNLSRLNFGFIGTEGNVITGQFPAPGSRISESTAILLTISDNAATPLIIVPHVEGVTVEIARTVLQQAGFVPRVIFADPAAANDTSPIVNEQALSAGMRLPAGTEIILRAQ